MFNRLFVLGAGILMAVACSAQDHATASPPAAKTEWEAGKHYFLIDPPAVSPANEVVEVFSYACPHCAHFQPSVNELKKRLPKEITFRYVPAIFHPSWEPFARAYFAAESMGVLGKTHQATFDALHRDRKPIASIEDIAAFYGTLGVDSQKFLATAQSFVIAGQLGKAQDDTRQFQIDGTPTIIVAGKYRLSASSAGGFPQAVELTLWLVQKELAAHHNGQ